MLRRGDLAALPPRKNPNYYGGDIPWVKTGELGDGVILDTEENITAEGLKNSSAKLFPKGSVAVAMYGATIGKVSILGIDAATNQACAVGIPDQRVTGPQYIFQYLRSQKEAFINAGKGGAQPNISQGVIKEWPFPLPPLAEQKRIADKLEAVLGQVGACRSRLDRLPALLKRFRQSVLAAATSGKLTEEWRITNGLNDEWEDVHLKDIATEVFDGPFGSHLKTADYTDSGVRVARLENIGWMTFLADKEAYISPSKYKTLTRHTLKADDVMFSSFISEEIRVATLPKSWSGKAINKSDCFCVRPDKQRCLPKFMMHRLACRSTFSILGEGIHGATRPRINLSQLKGFAIALPSLPEQQEIVRRVEDLFAFAERIEARLATVQKAVERLTPSVLAKAFRGELVSQDPADEPASELLERLRSQPLTKPARGTRAKRL